jgi:hypothetical protein
MKNISQYSYQVHPKFDSDALSPCQHLFFIYKRERERARASILVALVAVRYATLNGKILLTPWFMVFIEQFVTIWLVNKFPDFMKPKGYYLS